ncbi:MAG: SGNH/GDSL hydrolase family protein [Planctomycetaceae bacterium]
MLRGILRNLKHLSTAVLLLGLGIVLAEVWLQCRQPPSPAVSGIRADDSDLVLLVPSQVTHHEMRRLHSSAGGESGKVRPFRTNSYGLRGPEPAIPKSDGVYRILLLGDDTVAGTHLDDQATLSSRLQQLLGRESGQVLEVINAGVPGFSPLLSMLQYQRELRQLRPDLVVLHFDMSDVADDAAYRRFLQSADGRQLCTNAVLMDSNTAITPLGRILRTSALAKFVRSIAGGMAQDDSAESPTSWSDRTAYLWAMPNPPDLRVQIQHALDPVTELQKLTSAENRRLMLSTSPVFWQVVSADVRSRRSKRYGIVDRNPVTRDLPFQILRTYCDQAGIPLCDATPAFRSFASRPAAGDNSTQAASKPDADSLFEPDSTKLSKYGTALYAREIAAALLNGSTPAATPVRSTQRQTSPAR